MHPMKFVQSSEIVQRKVKLGGIRTFFREMEEKEINVLDPKNQSGGGGGEGFQKEELIQSKTKENKSTSCD